MFEDLNVTEETVNTNTSIKESPQKTFTEFGAFNQVVGARKTNTGNVFKYENVVQGTNKVINVMAEDEDQPVIIVRKSEGIVESIEFSCKCGRSSVVKLKYD